jgi:hypothetical protein
VESAFLVGALIGMCTKEVTLCLDDIWNFGFLPISNYWLSKKKNTHVAKTGYASVFVRL